MKGGLLTMHRGSMDRRGSILWNMPIQEEEAAASDPTERVVQEEEDDDVLLGQMIGAETIRERAVKGIAPPPPSPARRASVDRRGSVSLLNRRYSNARRPSFSRVRKDTLKQDVMCTPFEDVIPLPTTPRFSTNMSMEAQYAILKGYEDRLHKRISLSYPEHSNYLSRTKSPVHNPTSKQLLITYIHDTDTTNQPNNQLMRRTSTASETNFHGSESNLSDPALSKKMMLSRRMQLAHCLLDAMDSSSGLPVLNTSPLVSKPDGMNPVYCYNWWSTSWINEFGIQKPVQDH